MTTETIASVDPSEISTDDLARVTDVVRDAAETGTLDLAALPEALRNNALLALTAFARGERVTTIVESGKPLTTNEAARALGVSRTHLQRMFAEGRIEGFYVGSHLKIPASEITRILRARGEAMVKAREASASADKRRRDRAAKNAGI